MKAKLTVLTIGLMTAMSSSVFAATVSYQCQGPANAITGAIPYAFKIQIKNDSVNLQYIGANYNYWFAHYPVNQSVGIGQVTGDAHVGTGLDREINGKLVTGNFFSDVLNRYRWNSVDLRMSNSMFHSEKKGLAEMWPAPHDSAAGDPDVHHPQSTGYPLDCVRL